MSEHNPEFPALMRAEALQRAIDIAALNGNRYTFGALIRAADTMSRFVLNGEAPDPRQSPPDTDGRDIPQSDAESAETREGFEDLPFGERFLFYIGVLGDALSELLSKVEGK